ncbi:MAG: riboflavin synthase [Gammaproteobacteria bacterium]|nr:riboflavin synthase [Gammaproteobacteria bacterium]
MFTGIVQAMGKIHAIAPRAEGVKIHVDARQLALADARVGDSIAVNGVCLTVVEFDAHGFAVEVSPETLRCTSLGGLAVGDRVNLELALRLGDRLGGHLVSGHVDGVGRIRSVRADGDCLWLRIEVPAELARYVSRKGSICVDGVSLTVNAVEGATFEVQIIPHTREETLFGGYRPEDAVNIEVDLIARYLERLIADRRI